MNSSSNSREDLINYAVDTIEEINQIIYHSPSALGPINEVLRNQLESLRGKLNTNTHGMDNYTINSFEDRIKLAREHHIGNCDEYAALAADILQKKGIPAEVFMVRSADHGVRVIAEPPEGGRAKNMTFITQNPPGIFQFNEKGHRIEILKERESGILKDLGMEKYLTLVIKEESNYLPEGIKIKSELSMDTLNRLNSLIEQKNGVTIFPTIEAHAFVVIGRDLKSDPSQPHTWGKSAVICDAWSKKAYPADQYLYFLPVWSSDNNFNTSSSVDLSKHKISSVFNTNIKGYYERIQHLQNKVEVLLPIAKLICSEYGKRLIAWSKENRNDDKVNLIKARQDIVMSALKSLMKIDKRLNELMSDVETGKFSSNPDSIHKEVEKLHNKLDNQYTQLVIALQFTKEENKKIDTHDSVFLQLYSSQQDKYANIQSNFIAQTIFSKFKKPTTSREIIDHLNDQLERVKIHFEDIESIKSELDMNKNS